MRAMQPRLGLAGVLFAASTVSLAQPVTIAVLGHYTENRGWNDAGLGPMHQVIVSATVAPGTSLGPAFAAVIV